MSQRRFWALTLVSIVGLATGMWLKGVAPTYSLRHSLVALGITTGAFIVGHLILGREKAS